MTLIKIPQFPEPYWRASVNLPSFPKLEESIKADVVVVGAGITGITAAYLLAKQNINVVLIDAGVILNGTTAHTTAKVTAQHGLIYDEFINNFGIEKASLYYEAQIRAKELMQEIINEEEISCDFKKENAYLFTNSDDYIEKFSNEKTAYEKIGIPYEKMGEIPLDVPIKTALMMEDQAQFHPLKYLKGMLDKAIENGLIIFENTTAMDVEYNKNPAVITKDGHRIICNNVIQATHYPFYDGEGFYPVRMYPERSYILGIKTPKTFPGGMYINAESPNRSIRNVKIGEEELWLVVGENHKTGQGKPTIEHYYALQDYATKHFGVMEIPYRWSAQDYTTLDKLPFIGRVSSGQNRIFVATGFRKWGMTNGTIAAEVISDLIIKNESKYEELFTPSRFHAKASLKQFITSNADVAKHLVQGKLEFMNDQVKDLKPDEAAITRVNGMRAGVYKDLDGNLHSVDTTCKHMGCEVNWNSGDRTWDCPCHGSRYSYTGEVIEGPAKESLNKVEL